MKKYLLVIPLLAGLSGYSFGNCGNDNGHGNGCGNDDDKRNTTVVNNNTNVSNTINQTNANWTGTHLAADVAVRLADSKYLQLQMFDTYIFGSYPGQDVFGSGFNQTVGARVVIKLGKSYEENLLERQEKKIKELENLVNRLSQ